MKAAVGVLAATVLFAGCIGSLSEEERVREAAVAFYDAARDENAEKACDLLSDETKKILESQEVQMGLERTEGDASCEMFIRVSFPDLKKDFISEDAEITIKGKRAIVPTTPDSPASAAAMTKEAGEWKWLSDN